MDAIARALIDRVILAQAEFDRELYTGFSRSRRENNKAELIDAKEALLRYIDQLKSGE